MRRISKNLVTDLLLLQKLILPQDTTVFYHDPEDKAVGLLNKRKRNPAKGKKIALIVLSGNANESKWRLHGDLEAVLDFTHTFSGDENSFQEQKWNYIQNPEKYLRWVYPAANKKPYFLHFYTTATRKAKLLSTITKFAYRIGARRWIKHGSFTLHTKTQSAVFEHLNVVPHDSLSIFMGTPGEHRSPIISLIKDYKVTHFARVATSPATIRLLKNEKETLANWSFSDEFMEVPQITETNNDAILISSNIRPYTVKRSTSFSSQHAAALDTLYQGSARKVPLKYTKAYKNIINNIHLLEQNESAPVFQRIATALRKAVYQLPYSSEIWITQGHGDFTPWNCYLGKEKLHVYDWELSATPLPLFFDLFHFIFQSEIQLKGGNLIDIKKELKKVKSLPKVRGWKKQYKADFDVYYKLYLLQVVSFYAAAYQTQKNLPANNLRQLEVWETALAECAYLPHHETMRSAYIKAFEARLKHTPHAFLKFNYTSLEVLPEDADIDIAVLEKDIYDIVRFAKEYPLVRRVEVLKKSFMTTAGIYFKDNTFLSLDLIHQFKRKALPLFPAKPLLVSAHARHSELPTPALRFDIEYCWLFYSLNKAAIPEKYRLFYSELLRDEPTEKVSILNYLQSKYKVDALSWEGLFAYNPAHRKKIKQALYARPEYKGIKRIRHIANYLLDTVKEMKSRKGFIATFSGVDGAGKSTIIEAVKHKLEKKYRKKVVVLRHRPGIFPMLSAWKYGRKGAETRAANTLPRQGGNRSKIGSIIRFTYYLTDYLLGQLYVRLRYLATGHIVLYDRYYFDFMADPKRSNLALPKRVPRFFYRFIQKPKFNFFLFASPDEIRKRKKELDTAAIEELYQNYNELFQQLAKRYSEKSYQVIENKELDKTLNNILSQFSLAA